MGGVMEKVEGVLGAIRSRLRAEREAAVQSYEQLARALAAGRDVKPEEVERLLRSSSHTPEDLERDVRALLQLEALVVEGRQLLRLELEDGAAYALVDVREEAVRRAEAELEAATRVRTQAGQAATDAHRQAAPLLRLVPPGVARAWRETLNEWRQAAGDARQAGATEALRRVAGEAQAKAERAWAAVLEAAAAAPLEAVVAGGRPAPRTAGEAEAESEAELAGVPGLKVRDRDAPPALRSRAVPA